MTHSWRALSLTGFLALATWASGCPSCNIYNRLEEAVHTAEEVSFGEVLSCGPDGKAQVKITSVIRGSQQPGTLLNYMTYAGHAAQPGSSVIAIGRTNSTAGIYCTLLPGDLLGEVKQLSQTNFWTDEGLDVKNADSAAALLTGVSTYSHHSGAAYYKRHPEATQKALIQRLQDLADDLKDESHPFYRHAQLRFGVLALLRQPSTISEQFVIQNLDGWLRETRASHEELLAKTCLEVILTLAMEEPCHAWIRPMAEDVLQQAPVSRLAGLTEAMILSGMLMPDQIIGLRAERSAAPWIAKGLIAAAYRHQGVWGENPAMHLRLAAKRLDAKEASLELAQLTQSLQSGHSGQQGNIDQPPAPPLSYRLANPLESDLETQAGFDAIPPQTDLRKPPPPSRWQNAAAVSLLLLLPIYTTLRYRRFTQAPSSGRSR